MKKLQRSLIYAVLLCLGIFGSVQAEDVVNVKIDFAWVQDASGELSNKTAACIVVSVDGDEERVFCRYQLDKHTESFLRDNTALDKIFNTQNKLLKATPASFPKKINDWLTQIETGLSGKKLPASKSKIAPLFAEFVKPGVMEYSQYPGFFKHPKPYDLVLPRQTIDVDKLSYPIFALLAHNEVHRAVSIQTNIPPKPVVQSPPISQPKPQKNPELVKWVETLDKNSSIYEFLTNSTSKNVLKKYAEVLKRPDITEKLDNLDTHLLSQNIIEILIIASVVLLLIVIIVIFWRSGGSQKKMDEIIEENQRINNNLSIKIKALTPDKAKNPAIDNEINKTLITEITNIIRQQITVDDIVTKVASRVSEQNHGLKKDIFKLIQTEKEKVEEERKDLKQQVATSEIRKKEAEIKLANTANELTQTQSELVEVKNRQDRMHKSLESLMLKRFRVIKPADISIDDLLVQLTKQGGTWRWYQQVLASQYEACAKAMKEVQALNNPKYQNIIKLLNIDNILLHSREFVAENPYFETDEKLLGHMQVINGGAWLSKVFRADDLFKTYFGDIAELSPLANRLAVTAMMLEAALQELGVKIIKPTLLEKPSVNLPKSAYKSTDNRLLIELTHDKVISKLSDQEPQLVVDIEKYGFVTPKNPEPSMTILYADLAGWEFY